MKVCSQCRVTKELTSFGNRTSAKDGRNYSCLDCQRVTNRKGRLKYLYDLTPLQYEEMVHLQNGVCSGCNEVPNHKLHIDHDHATGKVRGLLCRECNKALGQVKDSIKTLTNLISYLERSKVSG